VGKGARVEGGKKREGSLFPPLTLFPFFPPLTVTLFPTFNPCSLFLPFPLFPTLKPYHFPTVIFTPFPPKQSRMIIKPRANRLKKDLVGKICQMLSDDSFRNYFNYQMNLEEYGEGALL
jgi:hypothetical protein